MMPRQGMPRQAMPRQFSPRQMSPRQAMPSQRQRLVGPRDGGSKSALRRGDINPRTGIARERAAGKSNLAGGEGKVRTHAADRQQQLKERRQQLIEQKQQRATERRDAIAKGRENLKGDNPKGGPDGRDLNRRDLKGRELGNLKGKGPDRIIGDRKGGPREALVRRGKGDRQLMLRNRSLAERTARSPASRALAQSTFGGRYASRWHNRDGHRRHGHWHHGHHHHHRHIHVIGWIGPLFWPYAYDDFVDYTFWPYAYDSFWPYAYDDVYEGFFGPYAVGGPAYYDDYVAGGYAGGGAVAYGNGGTGGGPRTATGGRTGGSRTAARPPAGATATAQICTGETSGLTDMPIERIAEVVNPDETQRAALNEVREAVTRAVDQMRSACPDDLPNTPVGRMQAMRQRLDAMRGAVQIVRPALDKFYNALNDEQKARFNALEPEQVAADAKARKTELSQVCSSGVTKSSNVPAARIEQALRLSSEQRGALENLNAATAKGAEMLTANCPSEETLTPPGRLAAMEGRLDAMLKALDLVQPALAEFYNSLSDEQKARFNQLGTRPRQQATR